MNHSPLRRNGHSAPIILRTWTWIWYSLECGQRPQSKGKTHTSTFGDFTQLASGRLELRLPDQVGGVNDFLQATGTATLNGSLEITPSAGINLALGDEFDFLFYGTVVGQFSSYIRPPLGQGLEWQTIYDVNWLTLKVVQA